MNFLTLAYACAAIALALTAVFVILKRREAQHPPTMILTSWTKPEWKRKGATPIRETKPAPVRHVHMLRVGRSSVERLTEGVQMRCCMAGCEEPFYMDGDTVAWLRDWLNATHADSVKVQAVR